MKYLGKSFSISGPGTKEYADNWERTFGKKTGRVGWTGPNEDEIDSHYKLLKVVPPERWPWGPPDAHEDACLLHSGGLFCDCTASEHDPNE